MAASPTSLDNGPPLPPNLQPPQQASVQGLVGQQGAPNGSASLVDAVAQKMMGIEQLMGEVGQMIPDASPVMNSLIDTMRKQMGAVLASGAQPPAAPGLGGGPGTLMPGGAPTS